jgi:alkaline phosphatase D
MSEYAAYYGLNHYAGGPLAAGPLVGQVGQTGARIWVQARDASELSLRIHFADGTQERIVTMTPSPDEWLCTIFDVEDLDPKTSHEYSFASQHGETTRYPLRLSKGPDAPTVRIAFGSCYKEYARTDLRIFHSVAAAHPDLFLLLGDTCYTEEQDRRSEAAHMQAHLRNRNNDALRPLVASVPTLGIWDDHDYGPNDSDGSYAEKERSRRCFLRMWAQREYGTEADQGIFSKVSYGPVDLFLLDSRWYRRERKQILGEEQLGWLLRELKASTAPVKLLLCGSQLLPEVAALPDWDWECFRRDGAKELQQLQDFLAEEGITGVVALSGDPHLGQLLHAPGSPRTDGQRGPDLWELTSSPIANQPWSQPVWPADSHGTHAFDRYLYDEVAAPNFGVVDIDLNRSGAEITLSLCDQSGTPFFSHSVALESLRTRPLRRQMCAAVRDAKHAYEFQADQYARYDLEKDKLEPGYPRPISGAWKALFSDQLQSGSGLDAVFFSPSGKAYFFLGNGYVRYDLAKDHADPGYPKYTKRHFHGVFSGPLRGVLPAGPSKVYFVSERQCVRYDLHADHADPGYPRPLSEEFPGVSADGIDGAVGSADGAYHFIRGDEVLRFDPSTGQVSPGPPRALSAPWFGYLS